MSFQLPPILLYHRVVNSESKTGRHKIYVHEKKFREQMKYLKENGYNTITFGELIRSSSLQTFKLSNFQTSVILTFDDGYEDNYTILFPLLKEFGFKAVIYLVTKLTRNEWALKEGEPELKMMTREMIREMSEYGIEFGGHTRTHVDLKNTAKEKAEEEITGCKKDVEEITGTPATSFAYPYGAYNDETPEIVRRAGFNYGITTVFGSADWKEDLMRIRRIEVGPKTSLSSFRKKTSGNYFQPRVKRFFSAIFK